jgi:phosphoserine phosphatase RsbU/P
VNTERAREVFDASLEEDTERQYHEAPCGYLSTTPDGLILRVNDTFLSLTGYERDALVGRRRFGDLLTAGGRIYHETHLAPMLRMGGKATEIALEIVGVDKRRVPVLVNSVLERAADGTPVRIRMAVFEATARREYERELLRAKQRAEESESRARALARTLQQTLIPPTLPQIAGLDVAVAYRPAGNGEELGGDFYDVFEIGAGDWAIAIGDVSGKGIDAAVVTALARHTLRAAAVSAHEPRLVLDTLNQVLLQDETERFCTVAFLRLRRNDEGWAVTTSSAGHPLPVLMRSGGHPHEIGASGSLLGFLDRPILSDTEELLRPGDTIVLYTDGVTEGRRDGVHYGDERLRESLVRHIGPGASLVEGILRDALDFQLGSPRDDIAIVALVAPPA